MRNRGLDPAKAAVYWAKAERFAAAARDAQSASRWDPAVSAAVHAGINAFDALCVRRLSRRAATERHDEAVHLLDEIRMLTTPDRESIARHFKSLLAAKHLEEYEDRLCDEREAKNAVTQMDRLLRLVRDAIGERG